MSGARRKRLDLEHWNQDQRWDRKRRGAEVKQVIPSTQTSALMHPKPAAKKASQPSPCSSGKSVSSKPGSLWNKGSVSCLQAISSETQSVSSELATTSKIPHRGKPPLAFRRNIHPAPYLNKHRSEHVRERVLNGSTHGAASNQIQCWDVQRTKNEMKHLFNRANTEDITDSELPFSAENVDPLAGVTHCPIYDTQFSESEDEESDDDDLLASWRDTFQRRQPCLITSPGAVGWSALTSTSCSNSAHSLEFFESHLRKSAVPGVLSPVSSDGCGSAPPLKQTKPPHGTPLPPSADILACRSSHGCRFSQRKSSCTSPSDLIIFSDSEELEESQECECEAAQASASAAEVPPSLKDYDDAEAACRAKQSLLDELSHEEEGNQCRICHGSDTSSTNPLLSPCLCSGSLQLIHLDCLKIWIETRLQSGRGFTRIQRCELCAGKLTLDPDMFDWNNCYRRYRQQLDDLSEWHRRSTSTSFIPRMRIWSLSTYKIGMRLRRAWRRTRLEAFDSITRVFKS